MGDPAGPTPAQAGGSPYSSFDRLNRLALPLPHPLGVMT